MNITNDGQDDDDDDDASDDNDDDDPVVYDPDGHDHDDARVKGMQLIR